MEPGISTLDTQGTSTHDAARHDGKRLFIDGSVLLACVVLVGAALASLMVTASPAGASTGSTGILTGNVIVKGAPAGFFGEVGVAVCPSGTAACGIGWPLFLAAVCGVRVGWQLHPFTRRRDMAGP